MTSTPQEPLLVEVLARASDPEDFEAWQARARTTGWCANPVRLIGATSRVDTTTGEVVGRFASADLPDRVLLKACGHRRATRCPTCSATYQADAYQLVAAGLRGGKGIPESVASHPAVFVTLTAPSFGPVHTHHTDQGGTAPCHRGRGNCPHGQPRSCPIVHPVDDPALGRPLCPDCFDYPAAVLWNAHAGDLWRRTTIAIRRSLATAAGIPRRRLDDQVRVSFSKVVEYQRRGSIHLHAVIRLDHPHDLDQPPPPTFDADLLRHAVMRAATTVAVPAPPGLPDVGPFRWGSQLDIQPVGRDGAVPKAVAGYLAKYATKSTDPAGLLDRRITQADLDRLDSQLNPYLARMVRTAWDLGNRPDLEHLRLHAWAHALGFRGHWLTKSRAYSTTFTALRTARHHWNLTRHGHHPDDTTATVGEWRYRGRGWTTVGDAWLAATAAHHANDQRRLARFETCTITPERDDHGSD